MVLNSLGDSLRSSLDKIRGKQRVSEEDVEEVVEEVQRALLQSDADVKVVKSLSDSITERALEEEPPGGVTAREHILRVVYEELVGVVGDEMDLPLENQVIVLAGLQGSGKTTTSAKMAWWFSKKGLKPAIIQTDTFRPGAYDQSKEMAERAEVGFYGDEEGEDPVQIAKDGLEATEEADVQIIDTEGRHALEDELIEELEEIHSEVSPDKTILVIDAATGKGVKEQSEAFNESVGIDGVVITKMDGTAKGGGALTAVDQTGSDIAFIGTGETVKDIERFETESFVSRLLGMGDLKQLQERVERASIETDDDWDPEDAFEGDFTMHDLRHQLDQMNSMGPLDEIMDMVPGQFGGGLSSKLEEQNFQVQQEKFRDFEIIMDSMTNEEMQNPNIIGKERKERISRGSGKDVEVVNELLEQYRRMKNVFNRFGSKDDVENMMRQIQQGGGGLPF